MTDLAALMRGCLPGRPSAPSALGQMASGPDAYTTSAGRMIRMADMNPHHRENVIAKARREGNADLAARLEASRPKE